MNEILCSSPRNFTLPSLRDLYLTIASSTVAPVGSLATEAASSSPKTSVANSVWASERRHEVNETVLSPCTKWGADAASKAARRAYMGLNRCSVTAFSKTSSTKTRSAATVSVRRTRETSVFASNSKFSSVSLLRLRWTTASKCRVDWDDEGRTHLFALAVTPAPDEAAATRGGTHSASSASLVSVASDAVCERKMGEDGSSWGWGVVAASL
mmetsp:Transcript_9757/g.30920  ORF Transcript_9757/g.30920 Transcript_9757/m.30920 type:complete len:212 (+) Transcript_9757:972-1607(+)